MAAGITKDHGEIGYRPHHHRTGADEGVRADLDAAEYRRVGANGRIAPNQSLEQCVRLFLDIGAGVHVVRENAIWSKKYVVLNGDTLPNRDSVFNGYVVSKSSPRFYERVIANIAPRPDSRSAHHMCECPNAGFSTDVVGLHKCVWVHEVRTGNSRFSILADHGLSVKRADPKRSCQAAVINSAGLQRLEIAISIARTTSRPNLPSVRGVVPV